MQLRTSVWSLVFRMSFGGLDVPQLIHPEILRPSYQAVLAAGSPGESEVFLEKRNHEVLKS